MAKPKGSPKTGGRQAGTRNKATSELQDLARVHTPAAIKELARLAVGAESETARVAAINSLLDRAHGKPAQSIGLGQAPDLEPIETAVRPTLTREQWLELHQAK